MIRTRRGRRGGSMRFSVTLEAVTAVAQRVGEGPLTYLNKGIWLTRVRLGTALCRG